MINEEKKQIKTKILESLSDKKKTFQELLEAIKVSKRTLAIKLEELEKEGFVSHEEDSRKSPWIVNEINLDKSDLKPKVVAALYLMTVEVWYAEFMLKNPELQKVRNAITKTTKIVVGEDGIDESGREDYEELLKNEKELLIKIHDEATEELKKMTGEIIINLLAVQSENDINSFDIINEFTHFMSIFIKNKGQLKESIERTESYKVFENIVQIPYPEIKQSLMGLIIRQAAPICLIDRILLKNDDLNKRFINILPKELRNNFPKKHTNKLLTSLLNSYNIYEEMGFPFNVLYKLVYEGISEEYEKLENIPCFVG